MPSSSEPLVFYDIPAARGGVEKSWSPNTLKTRLALNIKRIPYKTVWVEYPDIKAASLALGAPPTGQMNGQDLYTLPTIRNPATGEVVTDSFAIAQYLDAKFPERPLMPAHAGALFSVFDDLVSTQLRNDLYTMVVARTCTGLRPRSEAYFRATREPRFPGGVALETLAPVGSAQRAEHFAKFQAALGQLAVHIARGAPAGPAAGPFVMGREPGYADALLGARLLWAKRVLEDGEWEEVMGWHDGRWKRLMDALEEFAGVDEGEEWVSPSDAAPA